jgi:hypothetical protein
MNASGNTIAVVASEMNRLFHTESNSEGVEK